MESMVKDLARLSNMTRRELMQDMRSLVLSDRRDFPGDSQESNISKIIVHTCFLIETTAYKTVLHNHNVGTQ